MTDVNECPTGEQVVAYWREVSAKQPEYSFGCGPDRGAAVLAYIDRLIADVADRDATIEQLRGTLVFNREQAKRRDAVIAEQLAELRTEINALNLTAQNLL